MSVRRVLLVTVALVCAPRMLAQTDQLIRGAVVTQDGQPIAGVVAYYLTCCPRKYQETTTDEKGGFQLALAGTVIRLLKEGFQPQAVVVQSGTSEIRITMEPAQNAIVVRNCRKLGRGEKRIGWSNYGLQFTVPERRVRIRHGDPDVDYVHHVVEAKAGGSYLSLWFGPFAFSLDPDEELFANSVEFAQRNVVTATGGFVGIDSWGRLHDGRRWRQMAIVGEGQGNYREATSEDARLFDQIIDSMCTVPLPEQTSPATTPKSPSKSQRPEE